MKTIPQKLFDAADNHGEDSEPDHTVGDLQDLFSAAWNLMTAEQKQALLICDAVENIVDMGARSEFEVADLLNQLDSE
jgi:hypothetical protein